MPSCPTNEDGYPASIGALARVERRIGEGSERASRACAPDCRLQATVKSPSTRGRKAEAGAAQLPRRPAVWGRVRERTCCGVRKEAECVSECVVGESVSECAVGASEGAELTLSSCRGVKGASPFTTCVPGPASPRKRCVVASAATPSRRRMGRRKTTKRAAMADSEDPFACFAGADAAAPFRLPVSVVAWKGRRRVASRCRGVW